MSTFRPPVVEDVPAVTCETRGPALRLMRHAPPRARGVNVYYLRDGSVTETDPDGEAVSWDDVVQVWWGSTAVPYDVSPGQAAALIAAGYEVDG